MQCLDDLSFSSKMATKIPRADFRNSECLRYERIMQTVFKI